MSFFNILTEFLSAGIAPDEKGEFHMGQSEVARLNAYRQQKIEDDRFMSRNNFDFDNWMNDE